MLALPKRLGRVAMRKLFASAVVLGFDWARFAQKKEDDPLVIMDREKRQQAEALDRQYKRTMEQTRKESAAPRNDPWSNMRAQNDGKR
jgi:hypothetical protein